MFKDNLSFMYSTMESLRKEIEQEMKRTRLDKGRLYDLLLKIIDNSGSGGGSGGVGPQGPPGPTGPAGPAGPAGSSGECKCKCTTTEAAPATPKAPAKVTTTKKAPAKKKVVATSGV
jgi:hypothetical protein